MKKQKCQNKGPIKLDFNRTTRKHRRQNKPIYFSMEKIWDQSSMRLGNRSTKKQKVRSSKNVSNFENNYVQSD